MKFKKGQKVRIIEWVNMPQDMIDRWGINAHVGQVGIILAKNPYAKDDIGYDVKIKYEKTSFFCLEEELEFAVKVGEQLLFSFMQE